VGLVRFVAAATDADRAERSAQRVAAWLRRANAERLAGALVVLGPAPCPLARLEGRWRWHVLAKAAEPRALGRVVRAWRRMGQGPVIVDRDPTALL
jgi:primosomal protein N' (replication factor Y)